MAFAWNESPLLWVVGLVTAVLTAFYMTRQVVLTFFGRCRFADPRPDEVAAAWATRLIRADEAVGAARIAVDDAEAVQALQRAMEAKDMQHQRAMEAIEAELEAAMAAIDAQKQKSSSAAAAVSNPRCISAATRDEREVWRRAHSRETWWPSPRTTSPRATITASSRKSRSRHSWRR